MGLDDLSTFKTRSRPRGILTDADREYLRGERDLSRQAEFERRKAIRDRLFHGILDLSFLLNFFPDEDREAFVDRPKPESLELGTALRPGIAFLWTFLSDISDEAVVLGSIDAALKKQGWVGEAETSIEVEYAHRVEDSARAYWGRHGGYLRSESGGLVDHWKDAWEEEMARRESRSPDPSQVSKAKARFDELADQYLSQEKTLSDDELNELASYLPNENDN